MGYLLKPRNFLITLAIVAVLVLGIYNQVAPDYYGLQAVIHKLLHNLPIDPSEDTPDQRFARTEKRIYESHLINYGTYPKLALTQQEESLHALALAVLNAPDGSLKKQVALKELDRELAHRTRIDCVFQQIAKAISFPNDSSKLMNPYSPHVLHDWDCLRTLISTYQTYCGALSSYGVQYGYVFTNMCNNGIQQPRLAEVASEVCGERGKCRKVVAENKQ